MMAGAAPHHKARVRPVLAPGRAKG
jgi:hypothetical protein